MDFLLSLLPLYAWVLVLIVLPCCISYLYLKNKKLGKMAIGIFFTFALIGGWNLGQQAAQQNSQQQMK